MPYGDFDAPTPEDELMGAAAPAPRAAAPRPAAPRPQMGATMQRPAPPVAGGASRPQTPQPVAPRPVMPATPAPSPAPVQTPQPQHVSEGAAQTPDELQAILQAGFGGGVTFEEVKE